MPSHSTVFASISDSSGYIRLLIMKSNVNTPNVFFIGNGVLRVPSYIQQPNSPTAVQIPVRTPSWLEYMTDLWDLVSSSKKAEESRRQANTLETSVVRVGHTERTACEASTSRIGRSRQTGNSSSQHVDPTTLGDPSTRATQAEYNMERKTRPAPKAKNTAKQAQVPDTPSVVNNSSVIQPDDTIAADESNEVTTAQISSVAKKDARIEQQSTQWTGTTCWRDQQQQACGEPTSAAIAAGEDLKQNPLFRRSDFMKLRAPRQAQWFDDNFVKTFSFDAAQIPALRLHILGSRMHPAEGLLTNELLERIGRLVTESVKLSDGNIVEVITTNLDCSLEQNIATAVEHWLNERRDDMSVEITVMAGFRPSVTWKRTTVHATDETLCYKIRIWKVHGCLRDFKLSLSSAAIAALKSELAACFRTTSDEFGGHVPFNQLTPDLFRWEPKEEVPAVNPFCVFSTTEYMKNIQHLSRLSVAVAECPALERNGFDSFVRILEMAPLMMLGYSVLEDDIDIVWLLTIYKSTQTRFTLMASRYWDAAADARLQQMGIISMTFDVDARGFCQEPKQLQKTRRHEWRTDQSAQPKYIAEIGWEKAIQEIVSNAWLEPQKEFLEKMLASRTKSSNTVCRSRMVFSGLASIWHVISMPNANSGFPGRRRASQNYSAVDFQVPGGSALVPCMIAAVMLGPSGANNVTFFTNVPMQWSSWAEIEEFCLSAGIDVRPCPTKDSDRHEQVGCTSYILLWEEKGDEDSSRHPKQRFFMDVASFADEETANSTLTVPKLPKAILPKEGFQNDRDGDLIFIDRQTNFDSLASWKGGIILETGAGGIELLDGFRPTIWTSGIGSFLRTIITKTECVPSDQALVFPETIEEVLGLIDSADELEPFAGDKHNQQMRQFIARRVSFNRPPWRQGGTVGFAYSDELVYGQWLIKRWWDAGPKALELVTNRWSLLGTPFRLLGRGILTTIHEAGMMGAWEVPEGVLLTTVSITRTSTKPPGDGADHVIRHTIIGESRLFRDGQASKFGELLEAMIEIETNITITVRGESIVLPLASVERWNTVSAGDSVRGALAYGLWSFNYRQGPYPRSISDIVFASSVLATAKCYAGSFVNFLTLLDNFRNTKVWSLLWMLQQ
jgi:hypothetical protein